MKTGSYRMAHTPPSGQRLLPQVVDQLAADAPQRVFASFVSSNDVSDGFVDVSIATLACAVNKMAWWIEHLLGRKNDFSTFCYVGDADIRYTMVFLASVKCGWKVNGLHWGD